MQEPSAYFAVIKADEERLNKIFPNRCLYIMSIKNIGRGSTGGTVAEVSTRIAARHFAENTARPATDSEIADFHGRAQAFTARMATQKFNRQKAETSGVTITLSK